MGCISLLTLENWLIWLVVIGVAFAIVRLLLPIILNMIGGPAPLIMQILNIILWGLVLIFIIIIVFDLLSCAVGFPRLR